MQPSHNAILRLADDETLNFRDLEVPHDHPTGAQILEAAHRAGSDALLLQRLPSGDLETIRLHEVPDLTASVEFILSHGDRVYSLTVNDAQMEWAIRHISGATIRKLANLPETVELLLMHHGSDALVVENDTIIDLGKPGVEKFITRHKTWKLRVQGVTLEYQVPHVRVGDAMKRAGFDPTKAWDIYLLVAGHPKQKVDVDFIVDLTTPGIERIRLMQRNVDNGEGSSFNLRREFHLLPIDEDHLNATGMAWETVKCNERRWLLIHNYPLLPGYTPTTSKLALDIPIDYPQAQLDMFYFAPAVSRSDGVAIPNVHIQANIDGVQFQGWSRHRNGAHPWDPFSDNVASQLALVEHSLAREFGE
ncbi:multiubiquitin domain-containing protein [Burkholderia territorii]|uniref:multiubiquitin domain-containing protein n=1 Tax=Burkholderia territorii TaxID=1503055 RepID=UPI00075EF678|nr:multiubiquitin domain-containing protein [Burkholderia territorii]KWO58916.1 hypothetical protein WT98_04260 [Burkholderia territorii]